MRVLIDARPLVDPAAGGVTRVARALVEAFKEISPSSTEIILATTGSSEPRYSELGRAQGSPLHGTQHIHIRVPNKLWSAATILGVTSFDREMEDRVGNIDAVFLPNIGFVGTIKRPYVLLIHDLSFLIEPRWFSMKQRLWHRAVDAVSLIKNAAHLLAVSETTKHDAMRLLGIPEERITVIPLGPTLHLPLLTKEGLGEVSGGERKDRYVLALGGDDPRKNTTTAIEAVRTLREEDAYKNLEIVIPTNAKVSRQARDDNFWIRFVSRPSDSELGTLYSGAAAFLYPSWYEGYGLPLHEAASFGTPCIASTAGALPETAPPGTIFADPAKPHHWVEALRIVLAKGAFPCAPTDSQLQTSVWSEAAQKLNHVLTSIITPPAG
jgi:glycosyltransferase involved in cell wall biosynthesis